MDTTKTLQGRRTGSLMMNRQLRSVATFIESRFDLARNQAQTTSRCALYLDIMEYILGGERKKDSLVSRVIRLD